jgi:hypothetical protein
MATAWKIINHENRKPSHCNNTISLRIDNKEVTNQNKIANTVYSIITSFLYLTHLTLVTINILIQKNLTQ